MALWGAARYNSPTAFVNPLTSFEMSTLDIQQLSRKKVAVPVEPEFIIIQYGDFLSGESRSLYPIFKELKRSFGDRLHYIYRHYPFGKDQTVSLSAAMACEAAK